MVDDEPNVRAAAAQAFDSLQEHVGIKAIDQTIPTLLEALRQPGGSSSTALQALKGRPEAVFHICNRHRSVHNYADTASCLGRTINPSRGQSLGLAASASLHTTEDKPLLSEDGVPRKDILHTELKTGLYLVATPIGNLEDITLRALRVLKNADIVLAEDTRHSAKLLNHYEIQARMYSFHEHNEAMKLEKVPFLHQTLRLTLVELSRDASVCDTCWSICLRVH